MKISFLGLGVMGFPMAGHLTKNHLRQIFDDVEVSVYNRDYQKTKKWLDKYKGSGSSSPKECIFNSDVIISCLGRDEDVQEVVLNENFLQGLKKGAILVDHTTTSHRLAKTLSYELKQYGVNFLDAPVSGGSIGAEKGQLSIMVGGDSNILAKLEPILSCYAKKITHMGAVGSGQTTKMVNQICITGLLKSLSEAVKFAEAENLDLDKLFSAIGGGAAQSWQMDNRMETMFKREFDFGFSIKWMIKDLSYCLERARDRGLELKQTSEVLKDYEKLQELGHYDKDTSALILLYDEINKS